MGSTNGKFLRRQITLKYLTVNLLTNCRCHFSLYCLLWILKWPWGSLQWIAIGYLTCKLQHRENKSELVFFLKQSILPPILMSLLPCLRWKIFGKRLKVEKLIREEYFLQNPFRAVNQSWKGVVLHPDSRLTSCAYLIKFVLKTLNCFPQCKRANHPISVLSEN